MSKFTEEADLCTEKAERFTYVVLVFSTLSVDELRAALPEPIVVESDRDGGSIAIIGDMTTPRSVAAEILLDELWDQVDPILARLRSDGPVPDKILLRFVQYIGPFDDVNPGIVIDEKWVKALAEFNGVIDIDQYALEAQSGD